MAEQPAMLSERAKLRLRLAAGLLRGGDKGSRGGRDLGFSRENFYADIQMAWSTPPTPLRLN